MKGLKITALLTGVLLLAVMAFAGCQFVDALEVNNENNGASENGSDGTPDEENGMNGDVNDADAVVRTEMQVRHGEDVLYIDFSLVNITDKDMQLTFSSGQQYDFVVYDGGEDIYRWSEGKAFTLALLLEELKAGERFNYSEEWDLRDRDGDRVAPGTYTIRVTVIPFFEEGDTVISQEQLMNEEQIEIQ